MSGGRKRMAWRRIANRSASVRDRLDLKAWRRQKKYSLNDREALMRKWMIGFCLTFFVFLMCSAGERGVAYRSPILRGIGTLVCILLSILGFILGGVAWLLTEDTVILGWAVGMNFIGHPGVFRIFLGVVPVTIGLYAGGMWIAEKCSHSDEWTGMFLKALALLYLFAVMGILGVFYRRCSTALVKTSAAAVQTTSVAAAGAYAPEPPTGIGRPGGGSDHVARQSTGEFRQFQHKDIWPEQYTSCRRSKRKGYSTQHCGSEEFWSGYERVEVVNGEIVEPKI